MQELKALYVHLYCKNVYYVKRVIYGSESNQ